MFAELIKMGIKGNGLCSFAVSLRGTARTTLTPSLPLTVKIPGWKMRGRACKQYIFRSCNTSTFNAMCVLMKTLSFSSAKKTTKGLKDFKFRTFTWSFSSGVITVKGLNSTHWKGDSRDYNALHKLQTLVYDVSSPTNVIIGYAIGLRKLSANWQFLFWCSNRSKFVTTQTTHEVLYQVEFFSLPFTVLTPNTHTHNDIRNDCTAFVNVCHKHVKLKWII